MPRLVGNTMKNFFRSLRYLRPYRGRLAISIVCVLFIAVLWGGGMGMIAPIMKIMVDPEGLHGWAWRSMTQDRLGARIVLRDAPVGLEVDGQPIARAVDMVNVDDDGPAAQAGLGPNRWIIALVDDKESPPAPGRTLIRRLADWPKEKAVTLQVYDPHTSRSGTTVVTLEEAEWGSRILARVARWVPEPADYAGRVPLMIWALATVVAINLVRDALRFVQEYLVQSTVWRAVMDIRCDNYNVALRLPVTFYAREGASDTMSRFIQDTHEVARGQIALFGKTIAEPAKAVASLGIALYLSWKLTLLAMLAGPIAYLLIREFGRRMRRSTKRALESWAGILGVLEETLTGIRVVKTYTMESTERRRFFQANRRLYKQQRRIARIDAMTAPTVEILGITAGLLAAGVGGYWVLRGQALDASLFMAWMGCLAGMFDPVRKLSKVFPRFQRSDAAATRVFELNDQMQEKRAPGALMLPRHHESIVFENVQYRYPGAADDALRDIDLAIPAGQTLALVGPNGCGKTTLVSLLPRLMDPSGGRLLIDGHDLSQCSLRSLRRQIGFVTQETVLFNATIAENVSYGLRRPHREQVLDAARKAFVHEFVEELPEGYDTMVGEHGATLSGGQKQRITIARAILRNPSILIFDEATSQIDSESEQRIHQAMETFRADRTTLLIAHRFSTVMSANRIAVMGNGRIIDAGTHEELLKRCDLYKKLYETQFGAGQ